MKIKLGRRSDNLRDQRQAGGRSGGMPPMPLPVGMLGGFGLPGLILLLALIFLPQLCSGGDGGFSLESPFQQFPAAQPGEGIPAEVDPDAETVDFLSAVLDDIQVFWIDEFARADQVYDEADLILFTSATNSGCGTASSALGPFYCPPDRAAYLDIGFFEELRQRFGAPGDFAQAYVLAHEIGHHIQNITGISDEVRRLQRDNPDDANELSVRLELQADCLAGVWGYSAAARGLLEPGDTEEALAAAAAIGDDRIQSQAGGRVNPETWTHGSSEQRVEWFRRGLENGEVHQCDTFEGGI
jgi:predicted metalloprotease